MSKVIIKRYSVIFYGIVFLFLIKNFRKIKKEFQTNRQTSLGTPQVNTRDNNSNISNHKEFGEITPLSLKDYIISFS